MRRWFDKGIAKTHFVEWNGEPVSSVRTGFKSAALRAGLSQDITPHTLRHTAATWLMQNGASLWEASGFLGMSQKTLENVYGHHHPDHLRQAATAIAKKRSVSLADSLAGRDLKKIAGQEKEESTEKPRRIGGARHSSERGCVLNSLFIRENTGKTRVSNPSQCAN